MKRTKDLMCIYIQDNTSTNYYEQKIVLSSVNLLWPWHFAKETFFNPIVSEHASVHIVFLF